MRTIQTFGLVAGLALGLATAAAAPSAATGESVVPYPLERTMPLAV